MSWWITVYCRRSLDGIGPRELEDGIRGRDAAALAGVDYVALAEDYDVDAALVGPALAALRVTSDKDTFEVLYHPTDPSRDVSVERWTESARVDEELDDAREVREAPEEAEPLLDACVEVVGIELHATQFGDMGIVLAYEVARYLAQRGDGVLVDDENVWFRVEGGALVEIA